MKSNKVLLTSLILGGVLLAACQPGATVKVNSNSGNAAISDDGSAAGQVTLANTEVQIEATADDHGTHTPGADDATQTPDKHGTPGAEDNGTDVFDDHGTNVFDDHGTHTVEPEHTQVVATQNATNAGTAVPNLGRSIEFSGTIESVGNGFLVINGQTVWIGAGTEVKGDLTAGSLVKVEGFIDGNGAISAREIKSGVAANDDNGNNSNSGQGNNNSNGGNGVDDGSPSHSGTDDGSGHDANDDNGGDQNQGGDDNGGHGGGSDDGGGHGGGGDNSGHGGGK